MSHKLDYIPNLIIYYNFFILMQAQEMDGSPFKLYKQLSISYPSLLQPLMNERDMVFVFLFPTPPES